VNIFLILKRSNPKEKTLFVHNAKRRFPFEIPSNGALFRCFVYTDSLFFVQKVKN